VLDHFHVSNLANAAIENLRRRVQQQTLGHRGREHDPPFSLVKLLLVTDERLDGDGAAGLGRPRCGDLCE
jgi:transposase